MNDISGADVLALAAELREQQKEEEGCSRCANLEEPNRRGIRFCEPQGCYNPVRKCIFFRKD